MKKKLFLVSGLLGAVIGLSSFTACSLFGNKKDDITFNVDGQNVPQTMTAELGDLFIMPKVSAVLGEELLEVEVQVFDSTGAEVSLVNKKFKATDLNGYTIIFTASNGQVTETTEIKVSVSDTKAPTFSVKGTSGSVALLNDVVEVPECLVVDASSTSLTYTYSVKDPAGNDVAVTDNKFTVTQVGDYVITYEAEDASGNRGSKEFIVACKNAAILNNFETETDLGWVAYGGSVSTNTEFALKGNALKIEYTMEGSWGRICVPFQKADGSYWSWKELQNFEGLQLYVYSSSPNEFGLATAVKPIDAGKNTVYFSMEEIKAAYIAAPEQYSEGPNGFYLNIRTATPGEYVILDYMLGIYANDYVPEAELTLEGYEELPASFSVNMDNTITLPTASAKRDGVAMELSVSVTDKDGNEVTLTDNGFLATDLAGYKVTYTLTDEIGTKTITIPVNVVDTRIPQIKVLMNERMVSLGALVTIPASEVFITTGETLTANVAVYDPEGNAVTVTDGAFVASQKGNYTICYTVESAVNGAADEESVVITVLEGDILNGFNSAADIGWVSFGKTLETYNGTDACGLKMTANDSAGWARVCLPLRDAQGNFVALDDLLDYARVELYVNVSCDMDLGLCHAVKYVPAGSSMVSFTIAEIKEGIAVDPSQYEANENGFYLNVKSMKPGDVIIFENFVAVYAEDYKPAVKMTLADGTEVPTALQVIENKTLTLLDVIAIRKKATEYMTVSVKVYDSSNNEVVLDNNGFVATDLNGYTIVYTAEDDLGVEELRISVTVLQASVPNISVDAPDASMVYRGDEVSVPAYEIIYDEEELTATVTVTDENGDVVTVTDGKFKAMPGVYTITYTTAPTNGDEVSKAITVTCVNGKVLSDFSTVGNVQYVSYENTKEVTAQGYKLTVSGSETKNWARVCVPFQKADGSFYTWEEILEFDHLELVVSASVANEIGTCIAVQAVGTTETKLIFTRAALLEGYAADPAQYEANENGFYVNVRNAVPGEYLLFKSFVGVYADDYVPAISATMEGYNEIPETVTATEGDIFTVPALTAMREGLAMQVSVSVQNANGENVDLENNAFLTSQGEYTIMYTVSDGYGEEIYTVQLLVNEKLEYTFAIEVLQKDNLASVGTTVVLPESRVTASTGETLVATVSVKDAEGNDVEVTDNTFVPENTGVYTIVYKAQSEQVDGGAEATITYTVVKGEIVNSFSSAADIGWVNIRHEKEVVAGETGYGLKLTAKESGSWGRICIPFKTANGAFYGWAALQECVSVDMYIYASKDMSIGLCNLPVAVSQGFNKVTFTLAQILSAYQADPAQYSENENGFFITYNALNDGDYIVFENFVVNGPKVQAQNGKVLSDFSALNSVEWVSYSHEKELTEDGLKLSVTGEASGNWGRVCVPFRKADGSFYTVEEVQQFARIELTVICPTYNEIGLANVVKAAMAGTTTITFTAEEILAAGAAQYEANENGFYVNVRNMIPGEYIVFVSVVGVYPADYVENGKMLSNFADVSKIGWVQYTHSKEITDDGLKVTATGDATSNWCRVCVPFQKADGSFYTWEEVQQFARIELTVICPAYNEIGLTNTVKAALEGKTTITFTAEEILAAYTADSAQYSANENGFYINVRNAVPGEYIVFVSMIGYYA